MTIFEAAGCVFIMFGVIFSVLGIVGVIRLPDTYTRLHASGKTSTLGIGFLCIGAAILQPSFTFKLLTLILFITFSGPVASHAIAAAAYRSKNLSPSQTLPDSGIVATQESSPSGEIH